MKNIFAVSALVLAMGVYGNAMAQNASAPAGGFQGPGIAPSTVAQALEMSDETAVVLVGSIEKSLGNEKYLFKDATGTVTIEVDNEDWKGINVAPKDVIEIKGEIDKEMMKDVKIDVDVVTLKK